MVCADMFHVSFVVVVHFWALVSFVAIAAFAAAHAVLQKSNRGGRCG